MAISSHFPPITPPVSEPSLAPNSLTTPTAVSEVASTPASGATHNQHQLDLAERFNQREQASHILQVALNSAREKQQASAELDELLDLVHAMNGLANTAQKSTSGEQVSKLQAAFYELSHRFAEQMQGVNASIAQSAAKTDTMEEGNEEPVTVMYNADSIATIASTLAKVELTAPSSANEVNVLLGGEGGLITQLNQARVALSDEYAAIEPRLDPQVAIEAGAQSKVQMQQPDGAKTLSGSKALAPLIISVLR